jgi:hypothetical protein
MNQQRTLNPAGASGGIRSRYRAFLAQRNSGILANGPQSSEKFGQGLINIAIFIALFIGILALLGFGLSRLSRGGRLGAENLTRSRKNNSKTSALGVSSAPVVYPSGHAEVKMPASPNPATKVDLKKKAVNK